MLLALLSQAATLQRGPAEPAVFSRSIGSTDTDPESPALAAQPRGGPACAIETAGRPSSSGALPRLIVGHGAHPTPQGFCHDSVSSHPESRCGSLCNDDSRRSSLEECHRSLSQKRRAGSAGGLLSLLSEGCILAVCGPNVCHHLQGVIIGWYRQAWIGWIM